MLVATSFAAQRESRVTKQIARPFGFYPPDLSVRSGARKKILQDSARGWGVHWEIVE
jgi:hypothetical protein